MLCGVRKGGGGVRAKFSTSSYQGVTSHEIILRFEVEVVSRRYGMLTMPTRSQKTTIKEFKFENDGAVFTAFHVKKLFDESEKNQIYVMLAIA